MKKKTIKSKSFKSKKMTTWLKRKTSEFDKLLPLAMACDEEAAIQLNRNFINYYEEGN